ncbi:helix-turn-helix domain-containing protein [Azospirillum lipoferum]|uniref:helix-turn-helix domain-containing protein n=1 Tax=Azospirillum lipoferum TaxID=193 RepID=UPI0013965D1D|nr:helix-turn-helix transcriptional regulator [Azospirillum lipoferum]
MAKITKIQGGGNAGYVDETLDNFISDLREISGINYVKHDHHAAIDAARFCYETRKKAGLTQARLAKNIRVSQSVIARIESGSSKKGPTLDMLQRIARGCGMTLVLNTAISHEAAAEKSRKSDARTSGDGNIVFPTIFSPRK